MGSSSSSAFASSSSSMNTIPLGAYSYTAIGTNLPPINVQFDSSNFKFSGCNTISIPWSVTSSGGFTVGSVKTVTKNSCQNNNDQQYLQTFLGGNGYVRNGNNFYLTRNGKNVGFFTNIGGRSMSSYGLGQNSHTTFSKTTMISTTTGGRYGTQNQQISTTSINNQLLIDNSLKHKNNKPVIVTPAPVIVNPPKVIVKQQPVIVTPSPVIVNPTPVIVKPTPVIVKPTPVIFNQAPVVVDQTPVVINPTPVVVNPTPVVSDSTPDFSDPTQDAVDQTQVADDSTPMVVNPTPTVINQTPMQVNPTVIINQTPVSINPTPVIINQSSAIQKRPEALHIPPPPIHTTYPNGPAPVNKNAQDYYGGGYSGGGGGGGYGDYGSDYSIEIHKSREGSSMRVGKNRDC
jgi:hypothetical protein